MIDIDILYSDLLSDILSFKSYNMVYMDIDYRHIVILGIYV